MTDAEQAPKKRKIEVGDIIVPADGSKYVGEVTYVSEEEDTVRHRCRKTGKEWEKSYFGFFCRYLTVEELLAWDKKTMGEDRALVRENLALTQEVKELREVDAGRTRYCELCLDMSIKTMAANKELAEAVQARDAAREALRKLLLSRDAAWSGGHDWEEAVDEAVAVLSAARAKE